MLDGGNGGVVGGAVLAKVSHSATQGRHQKTLGVPCPTMPNIFPFDPIILGRKEENDKTGSCACVWTGGGRVERLPPKEEFDVLDAERVVGCVIAYLTI